VRRPDLLDQAVVHDDHGVGQRHRFFLRVRDVHEGQAQFLLPAAQLGAHLDAQEGVERRQRLVEQQHARLGDERARQRHALLLAAGQLARLAFAPGGPWPRVPAGRRARFWRSALPMPFIFRLKATLSSGREVREQREALEHHGRAARGGGQVGDVAVVQQDVAAGDRLVARDHAQRGALAAARGAQQAAVAAAGDAQVDLSVDRGRRRGGDGIHCRALSRTCAWAPPGRVQYAAHRSGRRSGRGK
jgi:hypothetical protein